MTPGFKPFTVKICRITSVDGTSSTQQLKDRSQSVESFLKEESGLALPDRVKATRNAFKSRIFHML